jgi:hypothetical protein
MTRPPYSQEISRQNKACFLFLLDQSFSMEEPLGSSTLRKCDELATAINGWLQNRCRFGWTPSPKGARPCAICST